MRTVYAPGGAVGIQEGTQLAKRFPADTGFGRHGQAGAGGDVAHPGRNLQNAPAFRLEAAIQEGGAGPDASTHDLDVAVIPRMKGIANPTDIDRWGRTLMSCITRAVPIKGWATGS